MIAVSKMPAGSFRKVMFKSKRKETDRIWSGETVKGLTDIVRFAPSACNTQPWFVKNAGGLISVYRYKMPGKRGIMPADKVSYYNRIDIGIFLCFTELCLGRLGIKFERMLYDDGGDGELTLNAEYKLLPPCGK